HPATPVLKPDKEWEKTGQNPVAMVFSDGVWYDPKDRLFKLWYMGGLVRSTCYATSADGIRWEKPALDVKKGTNVVHTATRDSTTVWLDPDKKDPARRFKLFLSHRIKGGWGLSLYFSKDGIHWSEEVAQSGHNGDRTTGLFKPVPQGGGLQHPRGGAGPGARQPRARRRRGGDEVEPRRADAVDRCRQARPEARRPEDPAAAVQPRLCCLREPAAGSVQ